MSTKRTFRAAATRLLTAGQGLRPPELGERRFLHPGPVRWLRALAWAIVLFFLIALAALPVIEALSPRQEHGGPAGLMANLVGAVMAVGAYALAVWMAEGRKPSELALKPLLPELAAGMLIGAMMFAAVMSIMGGFGLYEIRSPDAAPVWTAAGRAVQSGVIEEVMIRAILLRLIWRAFGPWIAFAISSALFGFGHIANPDATVFASVCIALEAGVMLGAFYALTGRIWLSIGTHAAWNFTQGYLFGAAVSGGDFGPALASSTARPGLPEWLTGGAFGPEASLPALVVCCAVGAAVMVLAWRMGHFARAVTRCEPSLRLSRSREPGSRTPGVGEGPLPPP
ncbi:type II CAAX endopeptidase family protein [Brevundimonas sp.]|uniref:CPBP family intramembrane glutamic endopeptidase n=1 Tax=Brevundimonas sp. TaxID=1871086 RepID=UPI002D4758A3|nr:type II CAAX endopeptidase family protein [Brevundimonas sp.]HYD26331.1 type II CAAX endopeptidase family protein [Brevundimonas sp.]